MDPLLYLVHRIPWPPNKGDKVRSFHLLACLAQHYEVHLGAFVDADEDWAGGEALARYCASTHLCAIDPIKARFRSLGGLLRGEPLTLPYYRNAELAAWVDATIRKHAIRRAVVFSSAMTQYTSQHPGLRVVVDFVDVDSAKWSAYGRTRHWPLSALYGREGTRLLDFERSIARQAAASVFVTPGEARLFCELAPECAPRVHHAMNGVDTASFSPEHELASPYPEGVTPIVFTGAMDYWPNVDAVGWFATEVLPGVASLRPDVQFYVVGMNPATAVKALARDPRVSVTGRVADVRPYLRHARAVVVPMRVARGIQNKVLEAMAMARPVVVSTAAASAIAGCSGSEYETAADAAEFVRKTIAVLEPERGARLGAAARARVLADYDWMRNLAVFHELVEACAEPAQVAA